MVKIYLEMRLMMPFPFMSSPFAGSNGLFNDFASPFAMMDRMMRTATDSLYQNDHSNNNGSMHSFTSTTVMSYNGSDGRPKVYQESTSRSRGPGGLEETRQAIRDSERGINKVKPKKSFRRFDFSWKCFQIQIGHRIGDRKHVVEREMNVSTGQISENVELENLDEEETDSFKREWRQRSGRAGIPRRAHRHYRPELTSNRHHRPIITEEVTDGPLAIEYQPRQQQSDTIDLTTEETTNDDDVKEIEQTQTSRTTSMKRKASSLTSNDSTQQRKHRHNDS